MFFFKKNGDKQKNTEAMPELFEGEWATVQLKIPFPSMTICGMI